MTIQKGGTIVFIIGLLLGILSIYAQIERIQFLSSGTTGLMLAAISTGGMLGGGLWGATVFLDKEYNLLDNARGWNKVHEDVIIPPLTEHYPSVNISENVTREFLFNSKVYVNNSLKETITYLGAAVPIVGYLFFSWKYVNSAEYNLTVAVGGLLAVFIVCAPIVVVMGVWLPRHISRHKIELHEGGFTVHNAFSSTTFENSQNTMFYGASGLFKADLFIDRVTGDRAMVWLFNSEFHSEVYSSAGGMSKVFTLQKPDKRVRSLMPFVVRQPMIIGALMLWFICSLAAGFAIV